MQDTEDCQDDGKECQQLVKSSTATRISNVVRSASFEPLAFWASVFLVFEGNRRMENGGPKQT